MSTYYLATQVMDTLFSQENGNKPLFGARVSCREDLPQFLLFGILERANFYPECKDEKRFNFPEPWTLGWHATWKHPKSDGTLTVHWLPNDGWRLNGLTRERDSFDFTDESGKSLQDVIADHWDLLKDWCEYAVEDFADIVPDEVGKARFLWPVGSIKRVLIPLSVPNFLRFMEKWWPELEIDAPMQAQILMVPQECRFKCRPDVCVGDIIDEIHNTTGLTALGVPDVDGDMVSYTRLVYCFCITAPATVVADIVEYFDDYTARYFNAPPLVTDVTPWETMEPFVQSTVQGRITWQLNAIDDKKHYSDDYFPGLYFFEDAISLGREQTRKLLAQAGPLAVKPGIQLDRTYEAADDESSCIDEYALVNVFLARMEIGDKSPTLTVIGRYVGTNALVAVNINLIEPTMKTLGRITLDTALELKDWLVLADVFEDCSHGCFFVGPDLTGEVGRALLSKIYSKPLTAEQLEEGLWWNGDKLEAFVDSWNTWELRLFNRCGFMCTDMNSRDLNMLLLYHTSLGYLGRVCLAMERL